MRVYIASRYKDHQEINEEIFLYLLDNDIDAFLPISINIDAVTDSEMKQVADVCYEEILHSDVLVAVSPYGNSVSAEIAFCITINILIQRKMINAKPFKIIAYRKPEKNEAMILPFIDYIVNSKEELVDALKQIENE